MLQVVSMGEIVQDPACYAVLAGKPIVFPDHYTINRAVFVSPTSNAKPTLLYKDTSTGDAAAAMDKPFFVATVTVIAATADTDGATLHFHIIRSDNPTEKVYKATKSATTVWRVALEDAARDFPDQKEQLLATCDSQGRLQVNGVRFYGLHMKEVQEELMALPGGAAAFQNAAAAMVAAKQQHQQQTGHDHTSPPASQPSQATTKAAKKKLSSPSPSRVVPKAKPASRKRTSRPTSADMAASPASTNGVTVTSVVEDVPSVSNSQPPPVVAVVTPTKTKRPRKPKADGAAASHEPSVTVREAIEGTEDVSGAALPAKRRRPSVKQNSTMNSSGVGVAPASAPAAVCPACGLAGTPFCAATGKPHDVPPCPACGLHTAFCPVSGQPHAGAMQRENRQRGEVHLPGTSRKPRRKAAAGKAGPPAAIDESVAEVTVVSTQDGSGNLASGDAATQQKQPRKRRVRTPSTAEGSGAAEGGAADALAVAATAQGDAPARTRRGRKRVKEEAAAATAAVASASGNATDPAGGATSTAAATSANGAAAMPAAPPVVLEGDQSLFELAKESIYLYPPLRPPLSTREHHKAALLLQESWKAQYGEGPVLPPAVAAVPLAFVAVKRAVGAAEARGGRATASKGRRRGRGGDDDAAPTTTVKEEEGNHKINDNESAKVSNPDDARDAAAQEPPAEGTEGEENRTARSSAVGSPTTASTASAALPSMVHPLEVMQLSSSAAGKRLVRFLLQYASERSQFDLLRSNAAAVAAAGGGAEKKKSTKGKGQVNGEGAEEGCDAVPKADDDNTGADVETAHTTHADTTMKMLQSEPRDEVGASADEEVMEEGARVKEEGSAVEAQ
ncbi:hypothetical protein ABB37_00882 [Leptomonas pyrrhocoris]|uniref:Uncharacterized protein n=1 Tax=Leptomonas pyrrhocoris TaxID=157538 RepID=A0A0M9GBB7_LEPPY|nr:hypothetical protein ABB37_00882 [Leptomonas pyrrhocoris]KPA86827.1 hypothetical protein ABB37_00882 [Leptomonas pyrrhocoris]|eukprot:XP_015665266.1 hypothetical protein ABB37_00882 [Leptomonas pyrrhocoris]